MRLKLTIAYDGRPYNGWQSQVGGNTVQDIIQVAMAEVAKQPLRLHGSGRTDTGVHALAQIAHFDAVRKARNAEPPPTPVGLRKFVGRISAA